MNKQRIRDPLHNLIEFNTENEIERVLWKVLETRPFQRLRRVKQLGFSDLVYPGATHSRFSHSVGVFHTARQLMKIVQKTNPLSHDSRADRALAAALVHDLGHGPFSHAFEKVGERLGLKLANHEDVSDLLIRSGEVAEVLNNEMGSGFSIDVADMVKKEGRITVHNAIVSSQFDADRLDYMRRDRMMTGTQHAAIDFEWLMGNLEIASVPVGFDDKRLENVDTFILSSKAVHAAEGYVLGLFQLYPTVYFHKATRSAELMFAELLVQIVTLTSEGSTQRTGLPHNHPIINFARFPDDIQTVLSLDDAVVWGSLSLLAEAEDLLIRSFASRLRDRKLYKCIDINTRVTHRLNPNSSIDAELIKKIEAVCAQVIQKLIEWTKERSTEVPRILVDEASRSPYKEAGGSNGHAEQINIRTDGGQFVDLKQRSSVVAALANFRLVRAYHDGHDNEAKDFIERIIEEEAASCLTIHQ